MGEGARHDAWPAGESYDLYMGRWSRRIAPRFVDWLALPDGRDWVEVGCGTGALSAAILAGAAPASLMAIEPSEGFLARAQENVADSARRPSRRVTPALPAEAASRDVAVSGLVLNFVPDRARALAEMRRVLRPGGTAAFYVWDYPGGGIEFMGAFWSAAVELDPAAEELIEGRRFPFCTPDALTALAEGAGFAGVDVHRDRGSDAVSRLRRLLAAVHARRRSRARVLREPGARGAASGCGHGSSAAFPRRADGSILLAAKAWAVRGQAV